MKKFYQLLRINHYIKNFLVFVPLLFACDVSNTDDFIKSFHAFLIFCILTSAVYIINDVLKKIFNTFAILSVLFYSLSIISINRAIFLTIPLVIYGMIRYINRSKQKNSYAPVDEIIINSKI